MDGASKFGIPVLGILGSVIKVGGNVLNPDVKMADLKRTEEQIENGHRVIGEEISQLKATLETLDDSFAEYKLLSLKLARDLRFKTDWEDIEAAHSLLLSNSQRMEEIIKEIQPSLVSLKMKYIKSLSVSKIQEFVQIVNETEGGEEARSTLSYAVLVKTMYLNLLTTVAAYQGDMESISIEFERFNRDLEEIEKIFSAIQGKGRGGLFQSDAAPWACHSLL